MWSLREETLSCFSLYLVTLFFFCDALFTVPLLYKRGKGGYEFCNWSQSRVDNIDFLSDLTLLCPLRTGNTGPRVVVQWTLKWLHSQRKYAGCSFLSCGTYFVFKVFKKTIRRLGSLYMGMWIISFLYFCLQIFVLALFHLL